MNITLRSSSSVQVFDRLPFGGQRIVGFVDDVPMRPAGTAAVLHDRPQQLGENFRLLLAAARRTSSPRSFSPGRPALGSLLRPPAAVPIVPSTIGILHALIVAFRIDDACLISLLDELLEHRDGELRLAAGRAAGDQHARAVNGNAKFAARQVGPHEMPRFGRWCSFFKSSASI